jgi:hypothetical protein
MKRVASVLLSAILLLALIGIAWPGEGIPAADSELAAYPWVYLRNGLALNPGEEVTELVAVGDVMLGRGVSGEDKIFSATPWLAAADIALGNLECAFATESGATPTELDTGGPEHPYVLIASSPRHLLRRCYLRPVSIC